MAMSRRSRLGDASRIESRSGVMGGEPCIAGTRIPAMQIVSELQAGTPAIDILAHYPTLPPDAIDTVRAWAAVRGLSLARDGR